MGKYDIIFMYQNDDVILTEFGEIMTYQDAQETNTLVERLATNKESIEYMKECEYWRKQEQEQQHSGSYHDLKE